METIGKRIFQLRTEMEMTQAQLAKKVGVSRVAVTKWESDQTKNLKLDHLVNLCAVFKISAEYLINGVKNMKDVSEPTKLITKQEMEANNLAQQILKLDDDDKKITKNFVTHLESKKAKDKINSKKK
jgi:transcriptional regulator with XRE-family HTH domain